MLAVTAFTPASADRGEDPAETEGFMLGLNVHASVIGAEEPTGSVSSNEVFVDEDGGGVTFLLGYGFTPAFALRFTASASEHKTTNPGIDVLYSNAIIEALYIFRAGRPFRPYLFGGIGGFNIESRNDPFRYTTEGPGTDLGAGFLFFPEKHFAIDVALRLEFVNWEKATAELLLGGDSFTVETPVEDEGSALKFLFGINYWF